MPDELLAALLACPSCALGEGRAGGGGWVLPAVLAVLPLVIGVAAGWLIARTVRRARPADDDHPVPPS